MQDWKERNWNDCVPENGIGVYVKMNLGMLKKFYACKKQRNKNSQNKQKNPPNLKPTKQKPKPNQTKPKPAKQKS